MKIPLSEAENYVQPSRSTIYEDARNGKLSTSKDPQHSNRKIVDLAELERCYGRLKNPDQTEPDTDGQTRLLIQSYENRIADLQKQLDKSNAREDALIASLDKAQANANLMLTTSERPVGWLRRLLGVGTG